MDLRLYTVVYGGDFHGRRTHSFCPGRGLLLIRFCRIFVLSCVEDGEREQERNKRLTKLTRMTLPDHPDANAGWSLILPISLYSMEHK